VTPPNADAALRVFLRAALRKRAAKYRRKLDRCRKRLSEDAVHDLRVETRRLLAALETLDGLVPRRLMREAARAVRKRTRGLGTLRDTQVQLASVDDLIEQWPSLSGLRRHLERRARRRVTKAARRLDRRSRRRVDRAIGEIRKALRRPAGPTVPASATVPALDTAREAVEQAFAAIAAGQPETIHHARKQLRRFRYLAEVFQPVVPGITDQYLSHLQDLQGDMGRIQDATVLTSTVDGYLRKHLKEPQEAAAVRTALQERRAALVTQFLQRPARALPGIAGQA
jgi:CHAD domain-containing protein